MESVIKLALKAGYIFQPEIYMHVGRDGRSDRNYQAIREDPLFWQALGKSLGWEDEWKNYWHLFIDHISNDKSADSLGLSPYQH